MTWRSTVALLLLIFLCGSGLEARTKRRSHSRAKRPATEASRNRTLEPQFDPVAVNNPGLQDVISGRMQGSAVLRAQILLDRSHFSVGEIDGHTGNNFYRAVSGFRAARGMSPDAVVDQAVWQALNADSAPALAPYTVIPEDLQGPFTKIPEDMAEKAKLPGLGYESPEEALAEKFHLSPKLLATLNPAMQLQPGVQILVPNVTTTPPPGKASRIEVSKSRSVVEVYGPDGKMIAQYPASSGSEHDPLPIGTWKIKGVARNPKFHYNPQLFWDADPTDSKATLPPGPNNPVGSVWIDLSKPHYGIHGTPEPSKIGYTQSHGCIRLTNWDALQLAELVSPGLEAILKE